MTQDPGVQHDAFTDYLITRLIPFVVKYRILIGSVLGGMTILLIALGIYSHYAAGAEQQVLNDIYTALKDRKEITAADLVKLDQAYGSHTAALEVKWRLAAEYVKQLDYAKAAGVYREIETGYSDKPVAVYAVLGLAACLQNDGKHGEAVTVCEKAAAKFGRNPRIRAYLLYTKAQIFYGTRDYAGAEEAVFTARTALAAAEPNDEQSAFDNGLSDKLDTLAGMIAVNK